MLFLKTSTLKARRGGNMIYIDISYRYIQRYIYTHTIFLLKWQTTRNMSCKAWKLPLIILKKVLQVKLELQSLLACCTTAKIGKKEKWHENFKTVKSRKRKVLNTLNSYISEFVTQNRSDGVITDNSSQIAKCWNQRKQYKRSLRDLSFKAPWLSLVLNLHIHISVLW